MISVLINGICGQMGRAVYAACQASDGAFDVVAGVDARGLSDAFDCPVYPQFDDVSKRADVIIDFSVPAALPAVLRFAQRAHIPAVIGTTGLSERDLKRIETTAQIVPVFQTGNMSLGVNLQLELARMAASALGRDFDVEIVEKHHRKKIDAPSGTALMLAKAVETQFPDVLEYLYGRHEKNRPRTDHEIGIHSVRGGTVVGEHEVLFIGDDEIVEITHKAYSKQVFARGALRAAQYLLTKANGLYSMQNIVTEHDVASRLYTCEDQAVVALAVNSCSDGLIESALEAVAARGINIDMIAMSASVGTHCGLGFSLAQASLHDAVDALRCLFTQYPTLQIDTHAAVVKLTVEGPGMALRHGVASKLLRILSGAKIQVRLITTSETRIEFCVDAIDAQKAVEAIQQQLFIPHS